MKKRKKSNVIRLMFETDSGRRFAPRVVQDKRRKKPKHKLRAFEE